MCVLVYISRIILKNHIQLSSAYFNFSFQYDSSICLFIQDADLIHRPLLKFLFLRSYEPYSLFIRSWIFKGRINDPYEEFVVEYSEKASSLCGTSSHCIKVLTALF